MEFPIKSSPIILFGFLSTPSGLAQWFADKVDVYNNIYIFEWEGNEEKAKAMELIENELIRFKWENSPKSEYFEFKIVHTEITGDTILVITDFAAPKELIDAQKLWESQVHELKMRLGGL